MSAHSCQSLTAAGCIHCTEAHVRSRVGSNGRSGGWPTSPARRRRLCATRAAAHSTLACGVPSQPPASSTARKCCARKALLSLRVPVGGSSWRMRLKAAARGPLPPAGSGAISRPASLDRRVRMAPT
eukprot:6171089-Pleurochrysis_carterae.AAC.1